jgi:GDPmannose 4,6-dehydratase
VRVNPRFYRPAEVDILMGNPSKAKKTLGWESKTSFSALVEMMAECDIKRAEKNRIM